MNYENAGNNNLRVNCEFEKKMTKPMNFQYTEAK